MSRFAHAVADWFLSIPPVFTDGLLYVLIALFGFQEATLSSDEAYKYISPSVLFWMKYTVGSCAAIVGALKMFRSTTYAEHLKGATNSPALPDNPQPTTKY